MEIDFDGVAEFLTLGFTLNEKTMLKNVKVPSLSVPNFEIQSKPSTVDDVYEALKDSVQRSIKPNMALSLSGGLDSRIMAGLVAEFDKNMPAYTFGYSNIEKKIAKKICSVLKLHHYVINDSMLLDERSMEHLKGIVEETGGVLDLFNMQISIVVRKRLSEFGVKRTLGGGTFDEVNGGLIARKVNSNEGFCKILIQAAHPILPRKYREIVFQNLTKCCRGIPFRKLFVLVLVKNMFRNLKVKGWAPPTIPVMDSQVLSALVSLPYHKRITKRVQRKILRKYFPKLYRIPYAMSMLPPLFPNIIHIGVQKTIRTIHKYTHSEKPCPLLTFDVTYFIRNNLHLLRDTLLKHPPPLLKPEDIKNLINNLNSTNASLLLRLSTYALIKE